MTPTPLEDFETIRAAVSLARSSVSFHPRVLNALSRASRIRAILEEDERRERFAAEDLQERLGRL